MRIMAGNVIWCGVRHVILRAILSRRDLGGYGDIHIFVNGYSMFGACAAYAAACVRMSTYERQDGDVSLSYRRQNGEFVYVRGDTETAISGISVV